MFRQLLWAWGPWIYNKTSSIFSKTYKIAKVVYNELAYKKEWIFFNNSHIPICSESFGLIENDNVKWRCKLNPPRFIEPSCERKEKHLSYLGFVIEIQGKPSIDLSQWINDVLYIGLKEPTLDEIVALWSCENGKSYFHEFDSIHIEYITSMGDTVKKGLNDSLRRLHSNV